MEGCAEGYAEGCTEVCRRVHGGTQRGAWRYAEGCVEVCRGLCMEVCGGMQSVHGGIQRGARRYAEVSSVWSASLFVHGNHW